MKWPIAIVGLALLACCSPSGKEAADAAPAPAPQSTSAQSAAEIRGAEARLVAHLEGDDPLAWVGDYTEDAVFQEGDGEPVSGRTALTKLAKGLGPLSDVAIEPVRTQVSGRLAYVQVRARYAVGKGAAATPTHHFRGVMIWRKDVDGVWRMLHEMLAPEPAK